MPRCRYCNTEENLRQTINGEHICDRCIDRRDFHRCSDCHRFGQPPGMGMYTDSHERHVILCEECRDNYNRCGICDRLTDNLTNVDGMSVCDRCRDDHFRECPECGREVHRDRFYYIPDEEGICTTCAREEGYMIEGHSFRPEWQFFTTPSDKTPLVTYGIEMEVSSRIDKYKAVRKTNKLFDNFAFVKRDGSLLEDTDFEIVTHPGTMKYHMENIDKWMELADVCKGYHAKQCGCHIHVSRNAFEDDLALARFLLFFSNNREFIEMIAQRKWNDYWKHEQTGEIKRKMQNGYAGDRYMAVNVNNGDTVEVRMFASNLLPKRIVKNLQFVEALVKFSHLVPLNKVTAFHFLNFIRSKDYDELYKFTVESIRSKERDNA